MIGGPPVDTLSIRRWYQASPDLVFRAFTEANLLMRWFCPAPDVRLTVSRLDLRIGGGYRFVFDFPGDRRSTVVGEYRTIARPHHLAFTWTWEPPDPHAGIETLVRIELRGKNDGTELALTHERLPDEAVLRQHESGWGATLDRLSELVVTANDSGSFPG